MRCAFRTILGFIPVVFGVIVLPARAGHFFAIQQSGISWEEEKLTAVTINKQSRTYQIANNPELLFKKATEEFLLQKTAEEFLLQKTADKKLEEPKFKLTIDLEDMYSGSLDNISIFLSKLANLEYNTAVVKDSGSVSNSSGRNAAAKAPSSVFNLSVPLLILENSTSFKFHKLFSGISGFFRNMPEAEVRYYHTGIQFPCAAKRGFGVLAAMRKQQHEHNSGRTKDPLDVLNPFDPLKQIIDKTDKLTLSDQVPSRRLSPKFSEETFYNNQEEKVDPKFTDEPELMLYSVVRYEEITKLKERWKKFGEKWPPLGVVKKEQVLNVYVDDFDAFSKKTLEEKSDVDNFLQPIVLEISGLLNDDRQIQKIINFCVKAESIRCVRIQDSMCTLSNLEMFFKKRDDQKEGNVLGEEKIRFLDIETALNDELRPVDLPEYFKNNDQEAFLSFLIWENPFALLNESFAQGFKNNHQLFRIFLEYLNLLQSEDYLSLLK